MKKKLQLTKQKTFTPINYDGSRDIDGTQADNEIVLEEWDIFSSTLIFSSIKYHCPSSNITLVKLINWHLDYAAQKQTLIFNHLVVGSVQEKVNDRGVRADIDWCYRLKWKIGD